jgi:hypothetical protein
MITYNDDAESGFRGPDLGGGDKNIADCKGDHDESRNLRDTLAPLVRGNATLLTNRHWICYLKFMGS